MHLKETTGKVTPPRALRRGQEVRVRAGAEDLGTGTVDDMTADGAHIWVIFGGSTPRRLFIDEDEADYRVVASGGR